MWSCQALRRLQRFWRNGRIWNRQTGSIGYSRTYVPKGTIENQILVLPCREQKAIFLSYVNSGDGAVTVTANYVVMPDEGFMEQIKETIDLEKYVSQISLK